MQPTRMKPRAADAGRCAYRASGRAASAAKSSNPIAARRSPRHWSVLAAFLAGFTLSSPAAERLVTDSFEITIDVRCEEGVVSCDKVIFRSTDRKSGRKLRLVGEDLHTRCADGVTPCRFLGHIFRHGKRNYIVWENGTFDIRQGSKVLLQEQGTWKDASGEPPRHIAPQ
jgi:hypothetical protein